MSNKIQILYVPEENYFESEIKNLEIGIKLDVKVENDACKALKLISKQEFDCIVAGYNTKNLNGIDLLGKIKQSYPDLPFILVTDRGDESTAEKAIRTGVSGYLSKQTINNNKTKLGEEILSVTEYKNKDDLLRLSEQLSKVVEILPGTIFLKNQKGEYYLMDNSNKKLFGIDTDRDSLGIKEADLFPPDEIQNFQRRRQRVIEKDDILVNKERITTENNLIAEVTRRAPVYNNSGDIIGVFGVATIEDRFDKLFNEIMDPIVEFEITNGDPIIIQTNQAFLDVFAPKRETVAGKSLDELIVPPKNQKQATEFNKRTKEGKNNRDVIERKTPDGTRKFAYRSVATGDNHGFALYADITNKMKTEKHLNILQRILRHNLRNDINVIQGQIKEIIKETDSKIVSEKANTIKRKSRKLGGLCEEAKVISEILNQPNELRKINIKDKLIKTIPQYQQKYQNSDIELHCKNSFEVYANDKIQTIIGALIENAIQHNNSSNPHVEVKVVVQDSDTAQVEVMDNGPGIPDMEKKVITEQSSVQPLSHGSGLGLWIVKWGTDRYGSKLSINTPDSGGSVVKFTLDIV